MRRRSRQSLPKEPVVLNIEKLSHEGRGIAHLNGKVVFVEEALPDEVVTAIYTQRRESFDQARTTEVIKASDKRVAAPCQYASICGGCSLQHFEAGAQLAFKAEVLHELLTHGLAGLEYLHLEPLTGPQFGYRRKARLAVRYVHKKSQVLVGFREKSSSFITNMSSCEVLEPEVSQLLPALSELIAGLEAYKHIPQIEVALGDRRENVNSLALVFRHLLPLTEADQETLRYFAENHGFDLYLQSGGPESVTKIFPPATPERLFYELPDFGLTMAFHPMDFTQVNAQINRKMIKLAVELLALDEQDKVLDLFCGLGNFSLPMATRASYVMGIEGSDLMVDRAKENAQSMGLKNLDFTCADLTEHSEKGRWLDVGFTKVLLDPPRSGAIEILPAIAALQAQRIVYVSCNPATLARDAACLRDLGYKMQSAGVMDMFPQTTHVESIALFIRA